MYETVRRRSARAALLIGALTTSLLALAACSPTTGSTSASGSPSATDATPTKITVAISSPGPDQTPFFAAIKEGFFTKAGLDVKSEVLAGGGVAMGAGLAKGEVDIALSGTGSFIQGLQTKIYSGKIIGLLNDSFYDVIARPGIKSMKDLSGKVIGISAANNGDAAYLQALVKHYNVSNVTFLATGSPDTRLAALAAGKIDATEIPLTQDPAGANVILSAKDTPIKAAATSFFANQAFYAAHKAALKKFMSALGQASDWVHQHPASAVAPCLDSGATTELCRSVIATSTDASRVNAYTWSSTGAIDAASMKAAVGLVAIVIPAAANLTLADIADTSIAGTKP